MSVDIPRPKRHLIAMARRYPDAWRLMDEMRADRGKGLPDWPEWCFLPLAGAYAIVSCGGSLPIERVADVARLGALAAWRVTQGIYRFDPDLFRALWDTPVEGDLPIDILYRLPEWCVYIETPGETFGADPLHGFFAHLEHDANDGRAELRLLLDLGDALDNLVPFPLHLVQGGLAESIRAMGEESKRQARLVGLDVSNVADRMEEETTPRIAPLVSLVMYLCSQAAEYIGDRSPSHPRPTQTRQGLRLFPPYQPTVWYTGFRIGAALRRAENERRRAGEGEVRERRSPRPHLRRAHWHAYWTGPRSEPEKRSIVLHWLPPIPVNIGDIAEIVPTIRVVKPRREGSHG